MLISGSTPTAATVGVNAGDGINSFNIGRFDHSGNDYDGPGGNIDGVDFLDDQTFCFSVGVNAPDNVPPIAQGVPSGNKLNVIAGQPEMFTITFIPPEVGQGITSITATDFGAGIMVCDPPTGLGTDVASITCTVTCPNALVGQSLPIAITATDGDPVNPLSTTVTIDVCCVECFMIIGTTPVNLQVGANDYLRVWPLDIRPMVLETAPNYYIPNVPALNGVEVLIQAALANYSYFPNDPIKMSPALAITIGQGAQSVGTSSGLTIGATDDDGNDDFAPGEHIVTEFGIIGL